MTNPDPEMSAHLEHVVDGLVNHTGGNIHRSELRTVVFDCYAQLAAEATVTTFLPVLTGRFAMMQVRAMGIVSGDVDKDVPEILVLDEHNAGRSQTAAALFRYYAPGRFQVDSAGVQPSRAINPLLPDLLGDVGIGLTDFPKPVTPQILQAADYVIELGPVPMGITGTIAAPVINWDIPDPADADREEVRAILAQVDTHVREFLQELQPDHKLRPPVLAPPA